MSYVVNLKNAELSGVSVFLFICKGVLLSHALVIWSFVIFNSTSQKRTSLEGVVDCDSEPPLISRLDVFGLERAMSLLVHSTCDIGNNESC